MNGAPLFDTGSVNSAGDATFTLLGPSDLRIVEAGGDTAYSRYGTSWNTPTLLSG